MSVLITKMKIKDNQGVASLDLSSGRSQNRRLAFFVATLLLIAALTLPSLVSALQIDTITPNSGSVTGGETVTLTGDFVDEQTVVQVATGSAHTLALTSDGQIYAWGDNQAGQLGDGTTDSSLAPVAVDMSGALDGKTITHIAAGAYFSLALTSDGHVYGWGFNSYGQLGDGSTVDSLVPIAVNTTGVLAGKTVTQIMGGHNHTVVLTSDNQIYSWGENESGQLGNGLFGSANEVNPNPLATIQTGALAGKTVTKIGIGMQSTYAITSDGQGYGWGYNATGQLGDGSTSYRLSPTAVNMSGVLAGKVITQITGGSSHALAITSDGQAYSWGNNFYGQLGNNSNTSSLLPVAVDATGVLTGKTVTLIAAGAYNSFALTSDGQIYSWGSNYSGELGNNTTTDSAIPVAVEASGALAGKITVQIAADNWGSNTSALTSDGGVYGWGDNSSGQLGTGDTANSLVPIPSLLTTYDPSITPAVSFGGVLSPHVEVVNATTLRAVTPEHVAGTVDVTAAYPNGSAYTLAQSYTFVGESATVVPGVPNTGSRR